jgi:NTP pyrophosphatase (non-canonical NTP hydrolase)
MDFKEYQTRTASTAIYPNAIKVREELQTLDLDADDVEKIMQITRADSLGIFYTGLGLGESGEVQGKIKKIIRDDNGVLTEEKRKAISKELGDQLWYLSQNATECGLSLNDIAEENLAKLEGRKQRGTLQGSGDER